MPVQDWISTGFRPLRPRSHRQTLPTVYTWQDGAAQKQVFSIPQQIAPGAATISTVHRSTIVASGARAVDWHAQPPRAPSSGCESSHGHGGCHGVGEFSDGPGEHDTDAMPSNANSVTLRTR